MLNMRAAASGSMMGTHQRGSDPGLQGSRPHDRAGIEDSGGGFGKDRGRPSSIRTPAEHGSGRPQEVSMADHKVVSREEWLAAREELLEREKEHTRLGD